MTNLGGNAEVTFRPMFWGGRFFYVNNSNFQYNNLIGGYNYDKNT